MSGAKNEIVDFIRTFPIPAPRCASFIKGEYVDYKPGKSLSMAFPVLEEYLNPAQSMQGGIISAAFDNVFGPFSVLEGKTSYTTTIDINTIFYRPIMAGDVLTVTVNLVTKGRTFIHMAGEAHDSNKRLIATCNTKYLILDPERTSRPATQTD